MTVAHPALRYRRAQVCLILVLAVITAGCRPMLPVSGAVPTAPVAPGRWRDHLGIILTTLNQQDLDAAARLGVGWVRLSWKQGWGADGDWAPRRALVYHAHRLGLKVMETCSRADNDYVSTPTRIPSFAAWCAGWVAAGVDAIEIGNEWNAAEWFPHGSLAVAADVTNATASAIRARSHVIPIVTNGWAPFQTPGITPAVATRTMLARHPALAQRITAVAWHPYELRPPSYLASTTDPRHDAFLESQAVALSRLAPHQEQWLTEFGVPSSGSVLGFSEQEQATQLQRLLTMIDSWHHAGIRIGVAFVYALDDGSWAKSYGIYTAVDGRPGRAKPAATVIRTQAHQPW